ncbi:hypothetical protein [Candidatus Nitrosocosmicus arcticus]|uniref:hypothetical protein n=1 Tax=Candidatus Nitrosocosmicus arcticus TaxID=2035267 RepID=UPI001646B0FB|nr:hypothetical protein [Candidatus Nitrosocosmicus arcticus]
MYSKPAVFIMILTLVIMLGYSPYSSYVFVQGKPVAGGHIECDIEDMFLELVKCCWFEDFGNYSSYVCQTCTEDGNNCGPIVKTDTRDQGETPPLPPTRPIPPTIGENVLQQEDEVLEQPADEGTKSPLKQGETGNLPELEFLEQQPADEGTLLEPSATEINQSATVE